MHKIKQGCLLVKFTGGGVKWFRFSYRTLHSLESYWFQQDVFHYAKVYLYDRKRKQVLNQIAAFGRNEKTGRAYRKMY